MQAEESKDNGSNPYREDSNPNSSEGCSDGWIRISIQVIGIPSEEKSETEGHIFESLNERFKSLIKNKWKDWSWIRITVWLIRVMKNKSKRFESLIQNEAEG